MDRLKHWGRLFQRGYSTPVAIVSSITLVVGGSVALAVVWGLKHLVLGIALVLASVVVTILEGSYRQAQDTEKAHAEKLAALRAERAKELVEAREKPAGTVHAPIFWQTENTEFPNAQINNTYAPVETKAAQKESEQVFIKAKDVEFGGSFINVHYGPPAPLPPGGPSTSEERNLLKKQLLELTSMLEELTEPYRMSSIDTARQMGIPGGQFMERLGEVKSEMRRVEQQITDRYIRECRLAVLSLYGHARSIGLADHDMESRWQSSQSGAVAHMHERLRAIADQIRD
jgi:hypothetical protein